MISRIHHHVKRFHERSLHHVKRLHGRVHHHRRKIFPLFLLAYLAVLLYGFLSSDIPSFIPPGSDKLVHFVEFFVLAILLYATLSAFDHHKLFKFTFIFVVCLAFGLFIEYLQLGTATRSFSWLDFVADAFGLTVALIFLVAFELLRE